MVNALIGDFFASKAAALVNPVNCIGIMGKGLALEFKTLYPAMFLDYVARCARKEVRLGEPYVYPDASGILIVNFPTKDHWRSPSRLADLERGLDYFTQHYDEWGLKSAAFPALGCGNGGLSWEEVGPLIFAKLRHLDIAIEVYAPYETPKAQLQEEFLGGTSQMELAPWPAHWPGRQFVDLDGVGDPGIWLEKELGNAAETIFGDPTDDEEASIILAEAYITSTSQMGFPLPSDFDITPEETRKMAIADFLGFIREWRRITIAEKRAVGGSSTSSSPKQ